MHSSKISAPQFANGSARSSQEAASSARMAPDHQPHRPGQLLELARDIAARNPNFQAVQGPGQGDRTTATFMADLRKQACQLFGSDFSEKKICGENVFAADFYFPEEKTIVEVALGLPNPNCESEKDILKAIMANELGNAVTCLYFISRPGASKKCSQPGRSAIKTWALVRHGLVIEVHELDGEPRKRQHQRQGAHDGGRSTPEDQRS